MDQERIGKFIAKCRRDKKLTQKDLAEKLGVTDRAISNWENGKNMPDLSLFKPLCNCLGITINDLMSGEKVKETDYQGKLEENIMKTIDYTNRNIETKNHFIGVILISFGVFISISAVAIFPSESSWGSIYSIFGGIISLIGISKFTKKLTYIQRLVSHFGYFIIFVLLLMLIDYIGVVNIKEAPRFAHIKVSGDDVVYYDTIFYDVIRCHVNKENETFKIVKNQKYDKEQIDVFCK